MKLKQLLVRSLAGVCLLALATGCTHMMPVAVQPTALTGDNKLPLHAVLVLNKELTDFKHEYHMEGDTWVYPFGPALQDYARQVAGASLRQVDEAGSTDAALANPNADIVLIPRPVKADQSLGVMAWSKVNFTLVVEWTALDRASKNTIWLKTITADATETEGNLFSGKAHEKILMQKLFDDLSIKTHDALVNSPELRGSAGNPSAPTVGR
jgi:hypothetical protein